MQIYQVTDERFKKYGKVISNVDFTELVKALEEKTPLPEGVEYVPGCEALEALPVMQELSTKTYGEMPIQIDPPMKRMSRPAIVAETGPNSMNPPTSLKLRNSGSS